MGGQMERALFRDDPEAQQEPREREEQRPVGQHHLQLANKPSQANANQGAKVTIEGLRVILSKQGYRCALSGVVLSPESASLDHIVPLSKGGKHTLCNLQIVHPVVNGLKGQMSQDEFMQWIDLIASNRKEGDSQT
jgi:5-methylcytosine-specific restriction endonuclease McrA